MRRKASYILMILALLAGGSLPLAMAARLQQGRVRRIKACVAIIPTMGEPAPAQTPPQNPFPTNSPPDPDALVQDRSPNFYPYLFFVLNQRNDLRPDGWEFHNPAAPPFTTQAQSIRWQLALNTPLKQDMAPYWEVPLNQANFNRLVQMDVIYLPIARNGVTNFTEEQRRILARLVDSGVTLWVDWARPAATVDWTLGGQGRTRNGFFTNLDFATLGGTAGKPTIGHPLLNGEYSFSPDLAILIGSGYGGAAPGAARAVRYSGLNMQGSANFVTVVPNSNGGSPTDPRQAGYIGACRYGAGFIVATAGNVGGAIAGSQILNPATTALPANPSRLPAATDVGKAEVEDVQFAWNVAAWSAESTASQKNGRHTGQSSIQVNGLIEQATFPYLFRPNAAGGVWKAYDPSTIPPAQMPGFVNPASPLVVDGVIIAAVRARTPGGDVGEMVALQVNPAEDFDDNAYTDDGLDSAGSPLTGGSSALGSSFMDLSLGQPYDRIMGYPLGQDLVTGMCLGELLDTSNQNFSPSGARAFAFVAGSNGLFSLPVPRRRLPGTPPQPTGEYWGQPNTFHLAPVGAAGQISYTGAPAFTNIPLGNSQTLGMVFGGGTAPAIFGGIPGVNGGASNGKIAAHAVAPDGTIAAPDWYYPSNQEPNRMGPIAGPVATAKVMDTGSGAVDTMVFATTTTSADSAGSQQGDLSGKVQGFVVASQGDLLTFPRGNNAPGGNSPAAGRTFVCARWLDVQPGVGPVPSPKELMWDPRQYAEVRVMDRDMNYVLARYIHDPSGVKELTFLPDGTGGQVQLPPPPVAFAIDGAPNKGWDLSRIVLLADYSVMPQPVDQTGQTIRPRFQPQTPFENIPGNTTEMQTGIAGGVAVGKDNLVYYGTGMGYMCAAEWNRGRAIFRWKVKSLEYQAGTGKDKQVDPTKPNYLPDYAFTAAPAAGDRIVFAAQGRNGGVGTAYVMEPDAVIQFKLDVPLPMTSAQAQELMLMGDHGIALPQNKFVLSSQQPWGRVQNQFVLDPDTGVVTFLNMENFSLDLTNARSPQQMKANGIDTGGRPAVPIQWCFRNGAQVVGAPTTTNPATAWIPVPLVELYRPQIPGIAGGADSFKSGPVISGDRIYLMGVNGFLHEIPLDPRSINPQFPAAANGLAGFDVGNTVAYGVNGMRKLRNVSHIPNAPLCAFASPAISNGLMAVSTVRGLTIYTQPNVVIADNNRVVEASGDSRALATVDTVLKHRIDLSEFPIPTDPKFANTGGRPVMEEKKILSRTAKVIKLNPSTSLTALFTSSDPGVPDTSQGPVAAPLTRIQQHSDLANESYLIADTGNNRCVESNAAGKAVWELTDFQDPFNMIPAGEPLKLAAPMDVQRWVERERAQVTDPTSGQQVTDDLYVVHTLVADTGNFRILEIVDKVYYQRGVFNAGSYPIVSGANGVQKGLDGQPIRWYRVLVWASQTNAQGLKLRYRTAQRLYWTDNSGGLITTGAPVNNPPVAENIPPYLPPERFLSYTMASVTGQQLSYPVTPRSQYFQFHSVPLARSVYERKPDARPGGDSIVFLRGRYKKDEANNNAVAPSPFREASTGGDQYRFGQGIIDPNVPIVTEIWDELVNGQPALPQNGRYRVVHKLNGINSIERTVRSDVRFAPETYTAGPPRRLPYLLIADADGVWEMRLIPDATANAMVAKLGVVPQGALAWGLSGADYAYLTGAGNGRAIPGAIYSSNPADHDPGGRRLTAASARRLPNGEVVIASRSPANEQPVTQGTALSHVHAGADVFILRNADFLTASERLALQLPVQYDPLQVALHGWHPDLWIQTATGPNINYKQNFDQSVANFPWLAGAPSIRWRASSLYDTFSVPTLLSPLGNGTATNPNAYELSGSYNPVQPNYADLVY
jgi:hypothetical protein